MSTAPWVLLHLRRRRLDDTDNYGWLHVATASQTWEFFSFSFELPWVARPDGRSQNNVSCIDEGVYPLPWSGKTNRYKYYIQLDTTNTNAAHRFSTLVHPAPNNLAQGLQGCIVPVHFIDQHVMNVDNERRISWFNMVNGEPEVILAGNPAIKTRSVQLMESLRDRYRALAATWTGPAHIRISQDAPGPIFLGP